MAALLDGLKSFGGRQDRKCPIQAVNMQEQEPSTEDMDSKVGYIHDMRLNSGSSSLLRFSSLESLRLPRVGMCTY